eukprot:350185-Chlamydomonas_euryale.AAC.6
MAAAAAIIPDRAAALVQQSSNCHRRANCTLSNISHPSLDQECTAGLSCSTSARSSNQHYGMRHMSVSGTEVFVKITGKRIGAGRAKGGGGKYTWQGGRGCNSDSDSDSGWTQLLLRRPPKFIVTTTL